MWQERLWLRIARHSVTLFRQNRTRVLVRYGARRRRDAPASRSRSPGSRSDTTPSSVTFRSETCLAHNPFRDDCPVRLPGPVARATHWSMVGPALVRTRARARRVRIGVADQVKKKFWAPGPDSGSSLVSVGALCTALSRSTSCCGSWYGMARMV
jgi:hypothetical protein